MLKNKLQILLTVLFLGFVVWWVSFQSVVAKQGHAVQLFENTYGLMALAGSIIGFAAARKWGGFRTVLGKSLLLFSVGLLAQEAGQLTYSYYTQVDKIQIPYPSLGDVAYFGSVLFYIAAVVFLAKAVGIKFSLRQRAYKVVATAIPLVLLVASYSVLLHNHHYDTAKPLTVFLDAGYPIGEAIYISIGIVAYLLSRKLLGGALKSGIVIILAALFLQYVSDFTFVFQGDRGTYVPGKFDDLFYLIAYFVFATAMIKFNLIYAGVRKKTQTVAASGSRRDD